MARSGPLATSAGDKRTVSDGPTVAVYEYTPESLLAAFGAYSPAIGASQRHSQALSTSNKMNNFK